VTPSPRTAADVERLARAIYGDGSIVAREGVVHVTALWAAPDGHLLTIRIGPRSPRSAHDAFVLSLSRARSDAILVTGRVLREEPTLRYDLDEPLWAWRREIAGREEPPRLVVLTSGRDLDPAHPALSSEVRPILFTTAEAAPSFGDAWAGVDVVGVEGPTARGALRWLREERGARVVTVEAGPSTTLPLYDEPVAVDELMLSVFHGPSLPEPARGAPFLDRSQLRRLMGAGTEPYAVDEPSGRWTFARYRRRGSSDGAPARRSRR